MINLRSLIDILPYYFKEQDTYKVNGKGLLERYLDIFGEYFDNQIVKDIDTLDDILDIDHTPEIYLGYLWEFLGSMPYANPKAIDPNKWKQYFNGFSDDTTIEALSKLWIYRKDSDSAEYSLTIDQIRALVKYSVALFSIRGTKKFFQILLRLYGFEVTISNGSTYPASVLEEDYDFSGTEDNFGGTNDNFGGLPESIFESKLEPTKLDSEWLNLDEGTIDNRENNSVILNVHFRLRSEHIYDSSSSDFLRLQDRMFNLINLFLPMGSRPHLIWDNVLSKGKVVNGFENKVSRSVELYVDRANIGSMNPMFIPSTKYPGWYQVKYTSGTNVVSFSWAPLRVMVKIIDEYPFNHRPAFIEDQPKRFNISFGPITFSEIEYEDGKVFTINPGMLITPRARVSTICPEDFNLTHFTRSFIINRGNKGWKKYYNYTLFNHYNNEVERELSNTQTYIPIIIQSATVRTLTNNADPRDDQFTPQQVVNLTTGEYLTFIEAGTKIPDKDGNEVDYSNYAGTHTYVQHIFNPGTYEFIMLDRPEYKISIEVTRVKEVLDVTLVEGLTYNTIDNENPYCDIRLSVSSNNSFLKNISTIPFYVESLSGMLWETLIEDHGGAKPSDKVGNYLNKPYFNFESKDLGGVDEFEPESRQSKLTFYLCFLSKPLHPESQYIKFTYMKLPGSFSREKLTREVTLYPVTGRIYAEDEVIYDVNEGTTPERSIVNRESEFSWGDILENTGIFFNPTSQKYELTPVPGVSVRVLTVQSLETLCPHNIFGRDPLYLEYLGLYDDEVIIKETSNPVSQFWNNGETISLGDPGHYRFYGINTKYKEATSNYRDINVVSNKYNAKYFLEVHDGNKTDDENYMLRTLISNTPKEGSIVHWGFDFNITLNKSILEASDILTVDPEAFDFEVLVYKGSTPNIGQLIDSFTGTHVTERDELDDLGNLLPNYKVSGHIDLTWDGTYLTHYNYPPGLYCVELHAKDQAWPGTPSYQVLDAYVVPQKFDGNLYFDVEVISKAWTSPSGQNFNIDPITGKRTWGWYKTNNAYLNSVHLVRYDPAIEIPNFKLKLTNNSIGYTRVYMYKLVADGSDWDLDLNKDNKHNYPEVLPPISSNKHWLKEAIPKDWGFPGEFDEVTRKWDYSKGDTGIANYKGRWLFTGTVYQLGETIYGPQEPGKYLFLVNQLGVDTKNINYAYLEVKEEIKYLLVVNPMMAILQGSAVGTTVEVISSAKYTNETLAVNVTLPDGTILESQHSLPYNFYAYRVGTYIFNLFKFEEGHWIDLNTSASFRVLSEDGIYPDHLVWESQEIQDKSIQVVTVSQDTVWSIELQDE